MPGAVSIDGSSTSESIISAGVGGAPQGKGRRGTSPIRTPTTTKVKPGAVGATCPPTIEPDQHAAVTAVGGTLQGKVKRGRSPRRNKTWGPSTPGALCAGSTLSPHKRGRPGAVRIEGSSTSESIISAGVGGAPQGKGRRGTSPIRMPTSPSFPGAFSDGITPHEKRSPGAVSVEGSLTSIWAGVGGAPRGKARRGTRPIRMPTSPNNPAPFSTGITRHEKGKPGAVSIDGSSNNKQIMNNEQQKDLDSASYPAESASVQTPANKVTRGLKRTPMDWEAKAAARQERNAALQNQQLLTAETRNHNKEVVADSATTKKQIVTNDQQKDLESKEFSVMDVVHKLAAVANNEEPVVGLATEHPETTYRQHTVNATDSAVVPEPPQSTDRQRPTSEPIISAGVGGTPRGKGRRGTSPIRTLATNIEQRAEDVACCLTTEPEPCTNIGVGSAPQEQERRAMDPMRKGLGSSSEVEVIAEPDSMTSVGAVVVSKKAIHGASATTPTLNQKGFWLSTVGHLNNQPGALLGADGVTVGTPAMSRNSASCNMTAEDISGVAFDDPIVESTGASKIDTSTSNANGSDVNTIFYEEEDPEDPCSGPVPAGFHHNSLDLSEAAIRARELPNLTRGTANCVSNSALVVAREVLDEDNTSLVQAEEVDPEEIEKKALEKKKNKQCIIVGILLISIALSVLFGAIFARPRIDKVELVPSSVPSILPSESPSSAPSGALDVLVENLPVNTLASLERSGTPQWKAWHWLMNHKNITHLEEWRKKQLFALATFFYSFEGTNWRKEIKERWMDDETEECLWFSSGFGFFSDTKEWQAADGEYTQFERPIPSCNDDGKLTSLNLKGLRLSGFAPSIPPEIAFLTSLSTLNLGKNDIKGPLSDMLPKELLQQKKLKYVDFESNDLFGEIPSELWLMTNLTDLHLFENALTGQLPSFLGFMTSMLGLHLHTNQLTGRIPSQLGLMTNLEGFTFNKNALTNQIPSELGLATNITVIALDHNRLTGSIPSQLAMISNLSILTLDNNNLTGSVPSVLESLAVNGSFVSYQWGTLKLENNLFIGTIPEAFCAMGKYNSTTWRGLSFDCSDKLCSCCWCPCPEDNHSGHCETNPIPINSNE